MHPPAQRPARIRRHASTVLIAFTIATLACDGVAADTPRATLLPDTVVSASRLPVEAREVGSSVSVIDADDIAQRRQPLVSDLLRAVPGVAVNRAGVVGTLTQVRMRGAEGNHTLVLIDGVEANDPVSSSEFNFAHLLSDDVERIEVLRGPQSALWGADALGGVVNVVTRRGRPGLRVHALAEAGSLSTTRVNLGASGGNERLDFAVSGSGFDTRGINVSRFGNEDDGYDNRVLNLRLGARPTDTLALDASLRHARNSSQFDPQDFAFPATPTNGLVVDGDNLVDADQTYAGAGAKLALLGGRWEHELRAGITRTDNETFLDGVRQSRLEGDKVKLSYQSSLHFDTSSPDLARHTLTVYGERERERFSNVQDFFAAANQRRTTTEYAVAVEWRVTLLERLSLSASARRDFNDLFADANTFRVTGAYLVPDWGTRVHASLGNGVANPNFFELFGFTPGTFAGNPSLRPEESRGFDVGVEQPLFSDRLVVDVTWFRTDLEDEIATVFVGGPAPFTVVNTPGASRREGVEVSLGLALGESLSASAAYTYLRAEDATRREEVRRPRHIASANLSYRLADDRGNLSLGVDYNGAQQDAEFVAATPRDRVRLGAYTVVNVSGQYNLTPSLAAFARVENLLDERYEEQFSFRSPGFAAYAGLRLRLE